MKTKTISIGVILPLTGKAATYGERALQGIQLAVDIINDAANNDIFLHIIVEDSQSQPSRAITIFTKQAEIDKVPVVIGLLTSDEALACAPLAAKYKIILFTPGATTTKLKEAGSYVFRNRESAELPTIVIAKACVARANGGKIIIFHANAKYAVSYQDSFRNACEKLGATIAGTVTFNEGKSDYRSELEKLRSLKPDVVYLSGYDSELGLILKQAHEMNLKTHFFASAGAVTQKLLKIAGKGGEGVIIASAMFDSQSDAPHIRQFVDAYNARFAREPNWLAANSYDTIQILAHVAEAGHFDAENIRKSLNALREFPGVAGKTTFDEFGGVKKTIQLVQVHNAQFVSWNDAFPGENKEMMI